MNIESTNKIELFRTSSYYLIFILYPLKAQLFRENILVSFISIKANLLRAVLTMLIIAFGIMALVGILTSIDAIKNTINNQFTSMGSNTFTISSREHNISFDGHRKRARNFSFISYKQAERFKEKFSFPAIVSISVNASWAATIKYGSDKTNPNIDVLGIDENYMNTSGYSVEKGRNFSPADIALNSNYAIIGSEVSKKIFKTSDALDKVISVGSVKYKVVGVLREKGATMSSAGDKIVFLPHTNVRQYFSRPEMSYSIHVLPGNARLLDIGLTEAEGFFRNIRNLKAQDETDFAVTASNSLAEMLIKNISLVTLAATLIGIITLFGAAIGLMNIMLVSVTERTREIGIRKAMGAKVNTIKQQFLMEAVIIGQMGGLLGIILGITIGNLVSMLMGGAFIVPWVWILTGAFLCFLVGIVSGYFPAVKAAKVDPIVSLRYE